MNAVCETCGGTFDKPVRNIQRTKHHFCSRRCSNIKSNELRWKHHVKTSEWSKCQQCQSKIDPRNKSKLCIECKVEKTKLLTIGDIKQKHLSRRQKQWFTSEIRNFCRSWNPHLLNLPCQYCGYSYHTELCHLKPIVEFDDSTPLGEVNDEQNIVVLCPNHHWEIDNDILRKDDIPPRVVLSKGIEPLSVA